MNMAGGLCWNRRRFLAAAGATVAPLVVPSSVFGAAGPAPSERITLGLIGVGRMGHVHCRLLAERDDVQVLAVCDVEEGRRQAAKQVVEQQYARREGARGKRRAVALYNDFRDLLARDDIDAVVISTPEQWHAVQAIEAVKAGKDVYGEKPMSLTIREARAMVNAVRRYGRVFQTGSMQRSANEFRVAAEMVRAGRIGKLKYITVNIGTTSVDCYLPGEPVPKGLDWDMWLGPAPWRPFNAILCPPSNYPDWPQWRKYRDYSGGQIADIGAHHFDIAQWGMGTDNTGPVEVFPPDGKEFTGPSYRYASGVMLHANPTRNRGAACTFFGTDGTIGVGRGSLNVTPKDLMPRNVVIANRWTYPEHHTDWLRAIRTRQKPICDVEIGCRSITISHIGNISLWLNRPLKWDPVKEEFVGDSAANHWLDRPKREPWTL
jgi:predicted dehydrogenase